MKNLPAKINRSQPATTDTQLERINVPVADDTFFHFTCSRHEIRISPDRQTHFSSKRVQFDNGRLVSEVYEGHAPAAVFDQALRDAQRLFADQTTWLLKQFSFFPLLQRTETDDDTR